MRPYISGEALLGLYSALYALMMVLGGEEDGVAGGPALGAVAEVDGGQASGYATQGADDFAQRGYAAQPEGGEDLAALADGCEDDVG